MESRSGFTCDEAPQRALSACLLEAERAAENA